MWTKSKKNPHPCTPPDKNSLINGGAEGEMFSEAPALRRSRSTAAGVEARSEEKMRSHTVWRVVSVSPRRSHRV